MNLKRLAGLDILSDQYAYSRDARYGYVSASKVADKWVETTCGYCSVGCGILIGVREGKAVAVRGNPQHPVNRGKLCPKGLSEHYTLSAKGRATHPLIKRNGHFEKIAWNEAIETMVTKFRGVQQKYGAGAHTTTQLALVNFLSDGYFLRHLRHMKRLYRERRDALEVHLGRRIEVERAGGLALITRLRSGADDVELARRAVDLGIAPLPLSIWYEDRLAAPPGLLLSVTNLHSRNLESASDALFRLIAEA